MEEQKHQPNGAHVSKEQSGKGTAETQQLIAPDMHAANPPDGQRSTGAETTAGADNSSPSTYRHGMFAQHLVRPSPQGQKDCEAYNSLARRAWEHFRPEGFLEEFMVEKIVTEMVRYARIIGHEQRSLGYRGGSTHYGIETVLRFSNSSERQLMRSMRELERIQVARETVSNRSEGSSPESRGGRAYQARPNGGVDWACLGSLIAPAQPAKRQPDGAEPQGSSQANDEAKPTGSTASDKNQGQTTTPSVSPFMRIVNESGGLPPDFPTDKKFQTDPPPSAEDDGPAAGEK